jgi:hypothetical protein
MNKKILANHTAWRSALALAALCTIALPQAVRAAEGSDNPFAQNEGPDEAAYRKAIQDGVAEYDARHFEEARSLFRRAHEMNPNARTFRGIGMTAFELRDYVSAVHNLSSALHDQRKPLSPEQHKAVQDLLERSRMFVDVATLTISPWEAHVTVDGHAPHFEPDGTLLFGFGPHTLEVSAPGKATRTITFNTRGGEQKEFSITLEAAPTPAPRASNRAGAELASSAKPVSQVSHNTSAKIWLLGAGVAALAAGGAGIYWARQYSELDSCRNPPADLRCTDEDTIKRQYDVSLGAMVVTGAAALTMGIIGALSWKSGPPATTKHSALDCSVSPFGISCGQTF